MNAEQRGGALRAERGPATTQPVAGRSGTPVWKELARFLPDLARLFADVIRDPRVPLRAKILAAAVATYLVSPMDVIPDFIPGVGQMDDVAFAAWGVQQLLRSAGYDVLKDLWRGSDDGFFLLMVVAGVEK